MADQKINALPTKTAPTSGDKVLMSGAAEEYLIDYDQLATAILNKLTSKTYSLDQGTKTLIAALNELNSKSLINRNFFKKYEANSVGWKRIAKYEYNQELSVANGSTAYNALMFLRTYFNNDSPMSAIVIFEAGYNMSSFKILSIKGSPLIPKIRHVVDTRTKTAYLEVYYNSNNSNGFTVSMPCNVDGGDIACWVPTDGESAEETTSGVNIVSTLDLTA